MSSDTLPIPHAFPFRFVDAALSVEELGGRFRFELPRAGESFALRMCPALLMVEAMAQAAACWFGAQGEGGAEQGTLASVDKARFSGRPRPGDPLTILVKLKKTFGALVLLDGEVWVHHRMLAQAEIVVRRGHP